MTESAPLSRLDQLAYELEKAKEAELIAKEHRLQLEQRLCEEAGVKTEGSYTAKGQYYKVTTSAGLTRTLDEKKWSEIKSRLPINIVQKVVKTRTELDTRYFKALHDIEPALYNLVAEAVTTKPKKVAVKFERIEGEQ